MEECIFCKIAAKEASADIVHEDERFLVFHDMRPKAPLHLLIIPRRHIPSIDHVEISDKELMGELLMVAQKVARQEGVKGYKLQINVGREGGQEIDHLHVHLLAQLTTDD